MPIRNAFMLAVALAGAMACGSLLAPARAAAASPDADMRDLMPTPTRPPAGKRPEVTLRPSTGVVPIGAPITFEVSSSINGFGHLYVFSASGRVQVWLENAPIAAGERLVFPMGGTGVRAVAPAGREHLVLVVTRDRINGFLGYEGTDTPRLLDYRPATFKKRLTDKFIDLPHSRWGYARASVDVVERLAFDSEWGLGAGSHAPPNLWTGEWEQD
jgi:hypothetical protein